MDACWAEFAGSAAAVRLLSHEQTGGLSLVRVCLRDPALLGELLSFLRGRNYIVAQLAEDMLLVSSPPGSLRLDSYIRNLHLDIDAWRQEHPSAAVILGPIDGGLSDEAEE